MIRWLGLCLLLAGPAAAQDTLATRASAAAEKLAEAQLTLQAAGGARDQIAALTDAVRAYEDGLIAVRAGLRDATAQYEALAADLDSKSAEVGQILGVLQTISRTPAPVMLLHPDGATGTARSGMIVADVTPGLQADVDALRAEIATVMQMRDLQENTADALRDGLEGVQTARAALSLALQNRTPLPARFSDDPVQTALLIASAETLGGFAQSLVELRGSGLPNDATLAAKGALPLPVTGRVLRRFNEADAAGVTRPGILVATPPRALVVSPTPATILFQGPLLTYGNVVIVEPTAGVMVVFAGLAELYGETGQIIPGGTPLGLMGGQTPNADANLTTFPTALGGGASQALYLEVRDGQTPVDPATWFALEQQVEEE